MSTDRPAGYTVGYKRPPQHRQFKPGQSGNPRGRPKGSLNLATVLQAALCERVVVNDHGQRRTISKFEAAVTQVVNKAAGGDPRAMQMVVGLLPILDAHEGANPVGVTSEVDREVLKQLVQRLNPPKEPTDENA